MEALTRDGLRIRQMRIGRTKLLLEEGYSTEQIAKKLCVNESTVRAYAEIIEQAEKNRK